MGELVAAGVRAERSRRRLSQQELAAQLGTSQTTVSEIEAGHRHVDVDALLQLCVALDVPLGRLLLGAQREDLLALGLRAPV